MAKVLIIDNDRSELEALAEMVEDWGFEALPVRSANEAREVIEEKGETLDTILLDWRLPGGEGLDVLQWIKEHRSGGEVEVIIQSGTVVPGEIRRGIRKGAYYFLTKPYSDPQLHALVQAAISSRDLKRKVRTSVAEVKDCFRLLSEGTFLLATIADAEQLAAHIGSASGDPQRGIGVLELLLNAIEHGNLGISYNEKSELLASGKLHDVVASRLASDESREKRVRVEMQRKNSHLELMIEDCGLGFDFEKYLIFDPERLFHSHGRGVLLARAVLDVEYIYPGNKVKVVVPIGDDQAGA